MKSSVAAFWLGPQFAELHPKLQQLHQGAGHLAGPVEVGYGTGFAGWLGRRLARRFGLPPVVGSCLMEVSIGESDGCLIWARRFSVAGAPARGMTSIFEPVGCWPGGHWMERSGAMQFQLGVDVCEGGWYWRVLGARLHGVRLPVKLLPQSHAYKRIEDGAYRFDVMFAAPLLGPLFWYRGLLQQTSVAPAMPSSSPADSPRP